MPRVIGGFVVLVLSVFSWGAGRAATPLFERDISEALNTAQSRSCGLLVLYSASWCEPCKAMKRSLFTQPEIVTRLKDFVTLEVDVDSESGQELWLRDALPGLPVLSFWRPDGQEIRSLRLVGVPDAEALTRALDRGRNEVVNAPQQRSQPEATTEEVGVYWVLCSLLGTVMFGVAFMRWRYRFRSRLARDRVRSASDDSR